MGPGNILNTANPIETIFNKQNTCIPFRGVDLKAIDI